MDNPIHHSEDHWVNDRLAGLGPTPEWIPDSRYAFDQLLQRQQSNGSSLWVRIPLAGGIVVGIGLVFLLLPWHALWKPSADHKSRNVEPVKAATPEATPAPIQPPTKPSIRPQTLPAVVIAARPEAPSPAQEQEQKAVEVVGPQVSSPVLIPESRVEPIYTDEARAAKIQGVVKMNVTVDVDGSAKVDKITQGLGYGLDEIAVACVEQWRFTPAMVDGKPVVVAVRIDVNFHLY